MKARVGPRGCWLAALVVGAVVVLVAELIEIVGWLVS